MVFLNTFRKQRVAYTSKIKVPYNSFENSNQVQKKEKCHTRSGKCQKCVTYYLNDPLHYLIPFGFTWKGNVKKGQRKTKFRKMMEN